MRNLGLLLKPTRVFEIRSSRKTSNPHLGGKTQSGYQNTVLRRPTESFSGRSGENLARFFCPCFFFPASCLPHVGYIRHDRLQESEAVRASKDREAATAVAEREAMQVCRHGWHRRTWSSRKQQEQRDRSNKDPFEVSTACTSGLVVEGVHGTILSTSPSTFRVESIFGRRRSTTTHRLEICQTFNNRGRRRGLPEGFREVTLQPPPSNSEFHMF